MGKISELKKYELQAEDIMFVVERKDQFNEVRLVDVMDKYAILFYNWMEDNYVQVGDGYVKSRNIDESKRVITTIENAMDIYKKTNYEKHTKSFD